MPERPAMQERPAMPERAAAPERPAMQERVMQSEPASLRRTSWADEPGEARVEPVSRGWAARNIVSPADLTDFDEDIDAAMRSALDDPAPGYAKRGAVDALLDDVDAMEAERDDLEAEASYRDAGYRDFAADVRGARGEFAEPAPSASYEAARHAPAEVEEEAVDELDILADSLDDLADDAAIHDLTLSDDDLETVFNADDVEMSGHEDAEEPEDVLTHVASAVFGEEAANYDDEDDEEAQLSAAFEDAEEAVDPIDDVLDLTSVLNDDGSVTEVALAPELDSQDESEPVAAPLAAVAASVVAAPLVSGVVEAQAGGAFAQMAAAAAKAAGADDQSAEAALQTLLRPMLRDWMDENLAGIVRAEVRREIARIAAGALNA